MLAADAAARGAALRRRGQATEKQHACGHGHAGRLPHGARHAEPSKSQEEPHRGSLSQRRLSSGPTERAIKNHPKPALSPFKKTPVQTPRASSHPACPEGCCSDYPDNDALGFRRFPRGVLLSGRLAFRV